MFTLETKTAADKVLPRAQCRGLTGTVFTAEVPPALRDACLQAADEATAGPVEVLPLTTYLGFTRTGNRSEYERIYFARRSRLLTLLLGELADGKRGKYLDKILDLTWAILEESTWVPPAHEWAPNGQNVPYEFGLVRSMDLFAAVTAADLSLVGWHLEEQIEAAVPQIFMERLRSEVYRRVLEPFGTEDESPFLLWRGIGGNYVNNWNPWIGANCTLAALLLSTDEDLRRQTAEKALTYANNFLRFIPADCLCKEGANYYFHSNGALMDLLETVDDATGGQSGLLRHDFLRSVAEAVVPMYAGEDRYFSIGDCGVGRFNIHQLRFLDRIGRRLGSEKLRALAARALPYIQTKDAGVRPNVNSPYRFMMDLNAPPIRPAAENAPLPPWIYMESTQIMAVRDNGLTLTVKGGHNHEPHGHNDVGEFMVYVEDQPLLIDPGSEYYTANTFNRHRFEQWNIGGYWHNVPVVDGVAQPGAPQQLDIPFVFTSRNVTADEAARSLTMELQELYPPEAGVQRLIRTAALKDGVVTVTDTVTLDRPRDYCFTLVSTVNPTVEGQTLTFSLQGKTLTARFSRGFTAQVDERPIPDDWMQATWRQPALYRVRLTGRLEQGTFTFRLERS